MTDVKILCQVLLLIGVLCSAAKADIAWGPWLQNVTQDAVTVVWEADGEALAQPRVELGATEACADQSAPASLAWVNGLPIYQVTLSGLEPGSSYYYRVVVDGLRSTMARLRTAPADPEVGFRFYVVGDSRSNPGTWGLIADQILADLNEQPEHHQTFLLNSGDLVQDGSEHADWDQLFPPAQRLLAHLPMVTGYGNHEDRNTSASNAFLDGYFATLAGEKWSSLRWAGVHVTSVAIYDDGGYTSGSQRDWLEADLSAAEADSDVDWIFGLAHFLPWSLGNHGESGADSVRQELHPVFRDSGMVAAFGGHNHLYARYAPVEGVTYLTTGGAGAGLHTDWYDPWSGAQFVTSYQDHHWCMVDVTPDAVAFRALNLAGDVIDWVTFGRDPADLPPFAHAGPDRQALVDEAVVLDGRLSADPEGAPLTHLWTQVTGPVANLAGADSAQPSFTPAAGGIYLFELRVFDGVHWSAPDFCRVEVVAGQLTFTAVADTYVDASRADTNFGTDTVLLLDTEPDEFHSYLRFDLQGIQGQVQRAELRLYCLDQGNAARVFLGDDAAWAEDWPTWNRPQSTDGPQLGSLPASGPDEWFQVDVTSVVAGDGPLAFVLLPGGSGGADFSSREGGHPPELIVSYSGTVVEPDGGPLDAGEPDAGSPDAGQPDAGPGEDAGVPADGDSQTGSDVSADAGFADEGAPDKVAGGCGCGSGANPSRPIPPLILLLIFFSVLFVPSVLSSKIRRR